MLESLLSLQVKRAEEIPLELCVNFHSKHGQVAVEELPYYKSAHLNKVHTAKIVHQRS
jgi:hypothetical protein